MRRQSYILLKLPSPNIDDYFHIRFMENIQKEVLFPLLIECELKEEINLFTQKQKN